MPSKPILGVLPITEGHKAQIWILAALSLPHHERVMAMDDIAHMLGTTYSRVQSAASKIRAKEHAEKVSLALPEGRTAPFTKTAYIPSQLRKLTLAELTAGRARTKRPAVSWPSG